jgi:hypothetical protein
MGGYGSCRVLHVLPLDPAADESMDLTVPLGFACFQPRPRGAALTPQLPYRRGLSRSERGARQAETHAGQSPTSRSLLISVESWQWPKNLDRIASHISGGVGGKPPDPAPGISEHSYDPISGPIPRCPGTAVEQAQ